MSLVKAKRLGTLGKFIMRDDSGVKFGCPPGKGWNYNKLEYILNNIQDYIGKKSHVHLFRKN